MTGTWRHASVDVSEKNPKNWEFRTPDGAYIYLTKEYQLRRGGPFRWAYQTNLCAFRTLKATNLRDAKKEALAGYRKHMETVLKGLS